MTILLFVIYIVFIALGLPDSLFGVAWPIVHNEFGIAESFASTYSIIVSITTGGISFIAGTLIRKFGTAKVTLVSVLITFAGLIGISFAPNIVVMMIIAVLMGYGAGAIDTGVNNFVALHYKAHHMNWLHCFWGVGITVSPLIMAPFLTENSSAWRNGYRVIALLELLIAVIVMFSVKKWQSVENASKKETPEEGSSGGKIKDILKIKGVVFGILSLGLYCTMEFLLTTWGATYAVNVFDVTPDEAAKWVSLFFGGIMTGRLLSGFASMKLSDKNIIRIAVGIAIIGSALLILPIGKSALLGFLIIGIGMGPVFPSILHAIPERFGRTYSADITGFHEGGAYGIGFSLQFILGHIASATTFKIVPFVLIAFCLGVFVVNEITEKMAKQ